MKSRQENFAQYHAAHPEVYRRIVELTREAKAKGRRKLGARAVMAAICFERMDQGLPQVSLEHATFYARLIMETEPGLSEIFRIRNNGRGQ